MGFAKIKCSMTTTDFARKIKAKQKQKKKIAEIKNCKEIASRNQNG